MNGKSEEQGRFSLPSGTAVYRSIGPFDGDSLPKGLLREHRLKEGTWARLRVLSGEIHFVWDDEVSDQSGVVVDGEEVVIPPTIPHHLELGPVDVVLEIDFLD